MNPSSAHRILGLVLVASLAACLAVLVVASGTGAVVAITGLEDRHVDSSAYGSLSEQEHGVGPAVDQSASAGRIISEAPTKTFSISGYKWHDLNADRIYNDGDDVGMNGWMIFIDSTDNGVLDGGEISSTTSFNGEDGYYEFSGLESGVYTICEVLQDGWTQSFPDGDGCHSITLAGKDVENLNFGNWTTATLSGTKWEDKDANDEQGDGEPGLANWEITLDGTDGMGKEVTLIRSTTAGGYYEFILDPGNYTICEVLQDGWTQSFPNTTDGCYTVALTSRQVDDDNDFGNCRIRQLTNTGKGVTNAQPSISGDGEWIAFVSDSDGNPEIYRIEVSTGVTKPVTASTGRVTNESPSTNRDGTVIAFISDGDLDPASPNTGGNAEVFVAGPGTVWEIIALTDTAGSIFPGFNLSPSIDDAGLHAAFASDYDLQEGTNTDGNLEIFMATRGSGFPPGIQVTNSALCTNAQPSLSGNGRFVAFLSDGSLDPFGSNADGNPEIFVAQVDIASMDIIAIAQVTDTGVEVTNSHPSISTLGGRIAFISDVDGNPEVFLAEVDLGSMEVKAVQPVTSSQAEVTNAYPSISGSGQYVAFVSDGNLDPDGSNADGNPEIFVAELDLESLEVTSITQITYSEGEVTNAEPSISTLGGRVAFISNGNLDPNTGNADGNSEVFVATFATGCDIMVQKTASADQVRAGEPLSYTITVRHNLGPPVINVVVTDTLTSSVVVEKGDLVPTQGSCGGWSDSTIRCELGLMFPDDMATLSLVITPSQAGVITNTVLVHSALGDPFPGNNEDTVVLWPHRLYLPLIVKRH